MAGINFDILNSPKNEREKPDNSKYYILFAFALFFVAAVLIGDSFAKNPEIYNTIANSLAQNQPPLTIGYELRPYVQP